MEEIHHPLQEFNGAMDSLIEPFYHRYQSWVLCESETWKHINQGSTWRPMNDTSTGYPTHNNDHSSLLEQDSLVHVLHNS
jgi:hypothetical protein